MHIYILHETLKILNIYNVYPQDQTKISLGNTKQLGTLSDMDNNSKQVQTTGFSLLANVLEEILCAVVQTLSCQQMQELRIATSQLREILLQTF